MASEGFFERVYEVAEQIPKGMVATYGQVALLAGRPRSARYVGYALHGNPRPGEIPCAIVWCLPIATYAMVLLLAVPMLSVSFCWGRAWRFKDDMHVAPPSVTGLQGSSGSAMAKTTTKVPVPFVVVLSTEVNLWRRCGGAVCR